MNILVFNSGSSSLKFKLLRMPEERELASGMVERIGEKQQPAKLIFHGPENQQISRAVICPDHSQALSLILENLAAGTSGLRTGPDEIRILGHRLVHGRELFSGPTPVDERALDKMEEIAELAPLHMPPALSVLRACKLLLPGLPQVACFDTSFYLTMPAKSYLYAVPREWYCRHGVRRYGFHGLSHQYITEQAAELLGRPLCELKLISAHLGNGASITAFDRGTVLDTSMGFTPLEGLIMGTRAGYLDPAVLPYIQRRTGLDLDQMVEKLNTSSGLKAISGLGRDLRIIMEARASGHAEASLAVDMYVHTLRKYIGAYHFALSGAHCLIFAGGVGEHAFEVRELVLARSGRCGAGPGR